jgi:hypothetical protein
LARLAEEVPAKVTVISLPFLRALLVGLVKNPLQPRMRTAQLIDHRLRPIEIFPPPLKGPIHRRRSGHIPKIADFVRQLDVFGPAADVGCVLDLQPFAIRFRQRFVVRKPAPIFRWW